MRHDVLTSVDAIVDIEQPWRDLLARSKNASLPVAPEWIRAWWSTFGASRELQLHCFWSRDALVGLAPLMKEDARQRGFRVQRIVSTANGHTPQWDILHDASLCNEDLRVMIYSILGHQDVDLMEFRRLPTGSETREALLSGSLGDWRLGWHSSYPIPQIETKGNWELFVKRLRRKFRQNLRRKRRIFAKEEGMSIHRQTVSSGDDPVFNQMIDVSKNCWKAENGKDLWHSKERRSFLKAVANELGPTGNVSVWVAQQYELTFAYEFHVAYGRATHPLRADFHNDYARLSPGSLIEFEVIRHCFNNPCIDVYDTCADDYWYLHNWTDKYREHCDVEFYSDHMKARALCSINETLIPAVRRIIPRDTR